MSDNSPAWPPPEPVELAAWSKAWIRRRHGELGPVRRGRCGFIKPNGHTCNLQKALASSPSIASMIEGRQWELGHCKTHLTDAEQDFTLALDRLARLEDGVVMVSGNRTLDEIDRLERGEWERQRPDRYPIAQLPACWEWIREGIEAQALGARVIPEAGTLQELWDWQAGRCAICGHDGAPDLDHDHWSGLIRGFLCKSCNGSGAEETTTGLFWPVQSTPWSRYRQLNPARWLKLRMTYNAAQHAQRWGLG